MRNITASLIVMLISMLCVISAVWTDSQYVHVLYGVLIALFAVENLILLKDLEQERKKYNEDKEGLSADLIKRLVLQNTVLQKKVNDAISELKSRSPSRLSSKSQHESF